MKSGPFVPRLQAFLVRFAVALAPAVAVALASLLGLLACAELKAPDAAAAGAPGDGPNAALAARSPGDEGAAVPIYPEDARWGSPSAPVTLVAVLDLECPFCRRVEGTLEQLREHYGPEKLRIVVKHYPLPFHAHAKQAALLAIRARRAGGDEAAFRFIGKVLRHEGELTDEALASYAADFGSDSAAGGMAPPEQLGRDLAMVDSLGVHGTPAFLVNGALVTGAEPYETFAAAIDAELTAVEQAHRAGRPASYADRVAANAAPREAAEPPRETAEDAKRSRIPIGGSPVQGAADALVTVVAFEDFQCPFCRRAEDTLSKLRARYGADVRFVFKHAPLSFHARALPAAVLASRIFAEKGSDAFWKAASSLFVAQEAGLDDASLTAIGVRAGLEAKNIDAALHASAPDAPIQADLDLGTDFSVRGTPNFFVNGRNIVGAQPIESFTALVDQELAHARKLVQGGVARAAVYDEILKGADGPPAPTVVDIGAVPADRPSRGPKNAPVVIYQFQDFQCPFCSRSQATLSALLAEFPKELRIVFLNLPLEFHGNAHSAATAALEVRAAAGDAAFWKMHDLLFENQKDLEDDRLVELAERAGAPASRVRKALETGAQDAVLRADAEAARKGGIRGTPGFVVNGYLVTGAQPIDVFRKAIRRALDDRKKGVVPTPNAGPVRETL